MLQLEFLFCRVGIGTMDSFKTGAKFAKSRPRDSFKTGVKFAKSRPRDGVC